MRITGCPLILIVSAGASLVVSGCSGLDMGEKPLIHSSNVEYLDREQVVLEEVSRHPTRFTINTDEKQDVWKRVSMLAATYFNTETKPKILKAYSPNGFHLRHFPKQEVASEGAQSSPRLSYAYEVVTSKHSPTRKDLASRTSSNSASTQGGASPDSQTTGNADRYLVQVFAVNASTGRQDADSMLVARNIARFLRTGVLERSLLKDQS